MAPLQVQELSSQDARQAFEAIPVPDPWGEATPESLARGGVPFKLTTAGGCGVFVLERQGDAVSILGASGKAAEDLTSIGLELIEDCTRQAGARRVKFQTARRGLVRKAERRGYQVVGWIMKKDL